MAMIHVTLLNIAGDQREIQVGPSSRAADLKTVVWALWHVPPECQTLVVGMEVVDFSERLADRCRDGAGALVVTVLVSVDHVIQDLERTEVVARSFREMMEESKMIPALRVLAQLGPKCCDIALTPITLCLQSCSGRVAMQALETLRQVAGRGNERAVDAVAALLEDPPEDADAAVAAVETLGALSMPGDGRAIAALVAQLVSKNAHIRLAAVQALNTVAEEGDEYSIDALSLRLDDQDDAVRRAATRALMRIV